MGSRHDFDFVLGRWSVHHRKLVDPADPSCADWVEFDSVAEAESVLGGAGHVDRLFVTAPADGGPPFEGFTLRLYEPATDTWRIWWSSSRAPGVLDPPVEGRFEGSVGTFETDDVVGGRPVRVRFTWTVSDPSAPRWQQFFSWDAGGAWTHNWTMQLLPVTD